MRKNFWISLCIFTLFSFIFFLVIRPTFAQASEISPEVITPERANTLFLGTPTTNASYNSYSTRNTVVYSYLNENEDGTFTRVEFIPEKKQIIKERISLNGEVSEQGNIEMELPLFGGVFFGENYNFVVFGEENFDEENDFEVLRVVKYDKNWERLGSVPIYGIYTWVPFAGGSLSMTEAQGWLYIHTCHTMFMDEDGLNHQSNMTFIIDEEAMNVIEGQYYPGYAPNYASHSFNQLIRSDGDFICSVDQGDAYPRGFLFYTLEAGKHFSAGNRGVFIRFPGDTGFNATGASLGGLEIGDDRIMIAGNLVDYTDTSYTAVYGQRNIFVLTTDRGLSSGEIFWITDYTEEDNMTTRTPQLVEVTDNQFLLMWEEIENTTKEIELKMVLIDQDANQLSEEVTLNARLSDCQPIVTKDGLVAWYVTNGTGTLYRINPFDLQNNRIDNQGIIASGACGDNAWWILSEEGVLTIGGTGNVSGLSGVDVKNSVKEMIVLEGITSIGTSTSAFSYYDSLLSVKLPESLTYIGNNVFYGCKNLETINLPENLEYIGSSAFSNCKSLKNIIIPEKITAINDYTFTWCTSLETVILPEELESIGSSAFSFCTSLMSIVIPHKITSIEENAFYHCDSLEKVYLPGGINNIGRSAFDFTDNLTDIYFSGRKKQWDSITIDENNYLDNVTIHCIQGEGVRLYGKGRYETAFLLADELKKTREIDKFDSIIIASGLESADALAGSYLASVKQSPIILTGKSEARVNAAAAYVKENLAENGTVYILGGTSAIPDTMEAALSGFQINRLAGQDRYETNIMILNAAGVKDGDELLVCKGNSFADSLSVSSAGKPILLVKSTLTEAQKNYLNNMKTLSEISFTIVGGTGVIPETLAETLKTYGTMNDRLAGVNRYETSVLVANKYFNAPDQVALVYSHDFPDGLSAGPLASYLGSPIILTRTKNPDVAASYIYNLESYKKGYIIGGSKLISDQAAADILEIENPEDITVIYREK